MKTNILINTRVWAILMACLTVLGVEEVWGVNWNKIDNLSDISNGDSVLVVMQDGKTTTSGKAFKVNGTTSDNSADVAITSNSYISNPANNIKWAMTKSSSNYILKSGTYYLSSGSNSTSNHNVAGNLTSSNSWYITKLSDGYFELQFESSSGQYLSWKGTCFGKYATSNFANQISSSAALAQYHGAISFYKKETGYAVTYNNGGHGTAPSNTTATAVTLAAITGVTGYTCTGWKANVAVTNTSTSATIAANTLIANGTNVTLSGATTFTAQWSANNYTISLDNQSATSAGSTSIAVTYNATTNLTGTPAITKPTKTHYDFGGYYTAVSGGGSQIIDANGDVVASVSNYTSSTKQWIKADDVTLYAKWTEHGLKNYRTVCCTPLGEIDGDVTLSQLETPNATKLKATWTMDAETGIDSYTLEVYKTDDDDTPVKTIDDYESGDEITGLDPCTSYYVALYTVSDGDPYCDGGLIGNSDEVTTIGYTYTVNATNCQLTSSSSSVPSSTCDGDVEVIYEATEGSTLPDDITVTNAGDEDEGWTWDSSTGELTIDASAVTGDVTVTIFASCADFSFFHGTTMGSETDFECFSQVGTSHTWLTDLWTLPSSNLWTYVGEPNWNVSTGKSANLQLSSMPYALNHSNNLGSISSGVMEGAQGYIKINDDSNDANRYVGFIPAGYVFRWGTDGSGWSSIAFSGKTSAIEEEDWYTPLQTWTSSNADDYTYVGLKTSSGYVWANRSETRRPVFLKPTSAWDHSNAYFAIYYFDASSHTGWSAIMTDPDGDGIYEAWIPNDYTYTTVNFVRLSTDATGWGNKWNQTGDITLPSDKNVFTITGGSDDAYTGEWSLYDKKGTFHISANSNTNNWYCHFLPHHVLHYDANSGSGAPADQTIAVNASPCQLTVSTTEPTRTGYTFAGWNESSSAAAKDDDWDGGDTHTMSADVTLYAVWTANTNTPYTVKHYKQKLDGTYDSTPDDTDNLTGTTATSVTPDRKSYTGFTAPSGTEVTILADGSRVVEYQYTRNSYTLTWTTDGDDLTGSYTKGTTKFGASITAPNTPTKTGYTFAGWNNGSGVVTPATTMPAAATTYTATWTANTNTAYTVEHYKQKLDGTYPASADETDNLTGTTATSVTPDRKSYTGFTAPSGQTETIAADGSLVIEYKYTRNKYNVAVASVGNVTITATPSGGSAIAESANADVYFGQSVTLANSGITSGYFWAGWKVTKQSDGTDVTASVVSTNTLTVPEYAINVSAGLYSNAIAWCDPDVTVTGDVHLTSYNGISVNSTSGASNLLTVASTDLGSATSIEVGYLDGNDDEVAKASSVFRLANGSTYALIDASSSTIDVSASRVFSSTNYSVQYTPNAYDQRDNYKLKLTFKRGDKVLKTTTKAIYGRALPEEFVIASKWSGNWYALPNTMGTSVETVTPIMITVDNATTPTEASYAPSTTVYKGAARYRSENNVNAIRFTSTGSNWLETSATAQLKLSTTSEPTEGAENKQVFYLNSSTFGAYELAISGKKLGMYNGNMGMYTEPAYTSEDIYLLPIGTKYTPVEATATDWTDDAIGVTATTSATKLSIKQQDGTETDPVTLSSDGTVHAADFDGDIDFTELTGNTILLKWYNGASFIGGSEVTVPSIITAGTKTTWKALEDSLTTSTTLNDIVVLSKPMTVGETHAKAKKIVMDQSGTNTGKLTIQPSKGLEVASTVKVYSGTAFGATTEADLVLESSSSEGNASLIFDNSNACQATVQMYSKASINRGTNTWNWQYVGTPFAGSIPQYNYYGSWMYKWYNGGWAVVHGNDVLDPFVGYCLTQESATTHVMGGTLVATDGNDHEITMAASTDMVLANSWTAPIWIGGFTASTFTSTPATIYLFNTGSATEEEGGASEATVGNPTEAGTYITVPVNSGPYFGTEFIPSMQGFFVTTNGGSAGSITLKYDELVRPDKAGYRTSITTGQMYAPKRVNKPEVMKIMANGSKYSDRVVLLERADFSQGFDNGWDGKKMSFGSESPSVYVINEQGGYDAVSAIPTFEGTVVGFRAGTNNSCTMTFEYDGDETLYLNDLQAQQSTLISKENNYTFTTSANDSEVRFIISATPIQKVPTGIGNDGLMNDGMMKVRKIIINDHVYIIRNGRMYSADGQMIK